MDDIMVLIKASKFSYDTPICTEKSLSQQYNVSRITAKRAIDELEQDGIVYRKRGVGSFVNRDKSTTSIELSAVKDESCKVIALVIPFSIMKGGMFKAIESASNILSKANYHFTFHITEPNVKMEEKSLKLLLSQNVDGIVYYPSGSKMPIEALNKFVEKDKTVIILDKPHDYTHISSVVCDNHGGSYMITEHLVAYGHESICYLSRFSIDEVSSIRDRYAGYALCLKDHNITVPPRFINLETGLNDNYPLLKHTINHLHKEGVTAIECENDEVAFNVYMCCRSLSIKVPEDMSITGFDNIEWATTGSAQITTVDQNFPQIGEKIATLALEEKYQAMPYVMPVKLIPRTSTGQVNKNRFTAI